MSKYTLASKTGGEFFIFKLDQHWEWRTWDFLRNHWHRARKAVQAWASVIARPCSLLPCIKKARTQDHYCLARALLQLHLDGAEFAVDYVHHALYFFWRNRSCSTLFPKQVHNVGGELAAGLKTHTFVSTNNKIPRIRFPHKNIYPKKL